MPERRRFGVFGDAGSFSEAAAMLYAQDKGIDSSSFIYLPVMEDLLAAVDRGDIALGLFPVVNFRGGIVKTAFEAMGKYPFSLVGSLRLNVQHCLITRPGASLKDITGIATHPQAFAQCSEYLKREFAHAEQIAWNDTAGAARDLATGKLPLGCAVIASERAAKMYNLSIASKSIQDDPDNFTVFVIVGRLDTAGTENT
jgi:prephenate dehydratase